MTDAQWRQIAPWVPAPKTGGRPAQYSRRVIVNAILYVTRNGCPWRALPHDLPPYRIVFPYFRLWQKDGTWQRIHDAFRQKVRRQAGKRPKPTAVILDSPSVKTTEQGGPCGVDAGKKIHGRKRFMAVDTLGLLWALLVLPASVQDRDGGQELLTKLHGVVKRVKIVWADAAFEAALRWAWVKWCWLGEVVRKLVGQVGFVVQPKRWLVERTFG